MHAYASAHTHSIRERTHTSDARMTRMCGRERYECEYEYEYETAEERRRRVDDPPASVLHLNAFAECALRAPLGPRN